MKLFNVQFLDDCEIETVIVVAETEEDAQTKINEDDYSCFMGIIYVGELDEIDGYKIKLEKIMR